MADLPLRLCYSTSSYFAEDDLLRMGRCEDSQVIAGIGSIALILSAWSVIAFAFTGVGIGVRWQYDRTQPDLDSLFLCFWLGFAVTLLSLQIWHCFEVIDWRIGLMILMIGCAGHAITRGAAFRSIVSTARRIRPWFGIPLVMVTIWVANQATAWPNFYDSGNYHFPVIHWVTAYPIVRGVGNVDGHLGLNNVSLLYQGMLEVGFWRHRSAHIGNGVLLLAVLLFCLYKLFEGATERRFSLQSLFAALLLTAVVDSIDYVSTPATDLPALMVMLVISYFLIDACEAFLNHPPVTSPQAAAFRLHSLLLLCAIALTIKLSAAVYALAAAMALLTLWLATREIRYACRLQVAVTGLLIIASTLLLWAGRSVLFTGYPFFPSLVFPFHVPWRVPTFYAEWYKWWITTFARVPDNSNVSGAGLTWIWPWITVELRKAKIAGILPLIVTIIGLVQLSTNRKGREWLRRLLPAWVPLVIALIAWFGSAPSFRFGEALTWILAGQCLALSLAKLISDNPRYLSITLGAILALPFSAILMHVWLHKVYDHVGLLPAVTRTFWVLPGPDHGMQSVPEPGFNTVLTQGGVTAYEPHDRLPCSDDRWTGCVMWYGPLPGAQRLKNTLAYLAGADPGKGFKITETRGEWIAKHAAEVQEKSKLMNTRLLAFYFQVAPKTILLALKTDAVLQEEPQGDQNRADRSAVSPAGARRGR